MTEKIAENIKKLRLKKNMSQQALCDIISKQGYLLKRNTYTKYESGKRMIPYELICRLAIYYNVSLDCIFGLDNYK